ncbi:MAG TPA: helix-turn-helix transcriptional regulator [Arsenicitalea sp.]|nr:helix-turn-helix transcriptional regulator [Arsenicitalea sp.]
MKSRVKSAMPAKLSGLLAKVGRDISVARKERGLAAADVVEAAGISLSTLGRLERGDPSVSLGAFSMVLLALGHHSRLSKLIDVASEEADLPRRVPRRKAEGLSF